VDGLRKWYAGNAEIEFAENATSITVCASIVERN
jgi:hypothetical protein